jgi:hypothetical protein
VGRTRAWPSAPIGLKDFFKKKIKKIQDKKDTRHASDVHQPAVGKRNIVTFSISTGLLAGTRKRRRRRPSTPHH